MPPRPTYNAYAADVVRAAADYQPHEVRLRLIELSDRLAASYVLLRPADVIDMMDGIMQDPPAPDETVIRQTLESAL